ncbi:MAG: hypothetical protein K0U41_06845 [Gammaproteobacteria bacterium]|nr:hypothetical protein [Gammaproteobacteria bacterium]
MDQSWKFTIGVCLIILVVGADNIYSAYKEYLDDKHLIDRSFVFFEELLEDNSNFYLEVLANYCEGPSY